MNNPNSRTIVHEATDINEQRLRDTENFLFTNALMMNHENLLATTDQMPLAHSVACAPCPHN